MPDSPYKRLRARLSRLLPRSVFMRNVAKLAGSAAIGQLLIIIASPILTRLYTPDDFGVLEVYTAIAGMLVVIACLRYEVAIPLPKEPRTGAALLVAALSSAIAVSALSAILLYLFRGQLVAWTKTPEIGHYIWLVPVAVLGAGVYNALIYWAVRKGTFNVVARTRVILSITQVTGQLVLGFLHWGPLGLVLGYAAGQLSGNGSLINATLRSDREHFRRMSWAEVRSAAVRYKDFPLLATLAALLNIAPKLLPSLLLAAFYGTTPAGLLGLSQRVIRVPMTMVSTSISQVYMNRAALVAQEDPAGLPRIFFKAAGRLFLIGIGPAILLFVTAPWLTSVAFGGKWREAGFYLQLVTPALLLEFIVSTLSPIIYVVERQAWQVIGDIVRFSAILAAFFAAHALSADPRWAVGAYAASMFITYIGFFALYSYAVKWRARVGFPARAVPAPIVEPIDETYP